jgi:hypothetical protein
MQIVTAKKTASQFNKYVLSATGELLRSDNRAFVLKEMASQVLGGNLLGS